MAEAKNVYQKLQEVRSQLSAMNLKKTGKNTYSNFTYYELSDFLPALNKLNAESGLMTHFRIERPYGEGGREEAHLDIINTEKPEEKITFDSETAEVEIGKKKDGTGGADRIQNIGGKQTYLRRYLLMMAYEISEGDSVDANRRAPAPNAKELEDDEIDKILEAKNHDELVKICRDLKAKKGLPFQKSIERYYAQRKEQLNNDQTGDQNEAAQ